MVILKLSPGDTCQLHVFHSQAETSGLVIYMDKQRAFDYCLIGQKYLNLSCKLSFFVPRCDLCASFEAMRGRAGSEKELELARALLQAHVDRYTQARVEIERIVQIGITYPRRLLTLRLGEELLD